MGLKSLPDLKLPPPQNEASHGSAMQDPLEPADPIVAQKSPFVLKLDPGTYWWCACGRSKKQPFCDGSHQGTHFTPHKVEVSTTRNVAFCGCKQSGIGAFCDGSHSRLS